MADTHEELQRRIAEDRAENPGCSYSTLRSSASSWVNGASRAETLTRIIRQCQGQAPVEIYTHQETNDGGAQAAGASQRPSQPALPAPGGGGGNPWGELVPVPPAGGGGNGGRDLFSGLVEEAFAGILGGIFGGLGGPGGHAFPFPPPPGAFGGGGDGAQQQPHQPQARPPAPPHAYPRGGWQPGGGNRNAPFGGGPGEGSGGGRGDGGGVTEI